MPDHERAMLVYARLASLAWQKQQFWGRDKFLILAGAAACRAGYRDVAERCRRLVLEHNSRHTIGGHSSFAQAMRSPAFRPFLKRLERFCNYEKAEHLLAELRVDPNLPEAENGKSAGQWVLELLGDD